MPTRLELLSSINPSMKLTKSFFKQMYGHEITCPGFANQALIELEKSGCSKAREYYKQFVYEYEQDYNKTMKEVASWFRKKCEEEFENRKRRDVRECKENLMNMSNEELLKYLENLIEEV